MVKIHPELVHLYYENNSKEDTTPMASYYDLLNRVKKTLVKGDPNIGYQGRPPKLSEAIANPYANTNNLRGVFWNVRNIQQNIFDENDLEKNRLSVNDDNIRDFFNHKKIAQTTFNRLFDEYDLTEREKDNMLLSVLKQSGEIQQFVKSDYDPKEFNEKENAKYALETYRVLKTALKENPKYSETDLLKNPSLINKVFNDHYQKMQQEDLEKLTAITDENGHLKTAYTLNSFKPTNPLYTDILEYGLEDYNPVRALDRQFERALQTQNELTPSTFKAFGVNQYKGRSYLNKLHAQVGDTIFIDGGITTVNSKSKQHMYATPTAPINTTGVRTYHFVKIKDDGTEISINSHLTDMVSRYLNRANALVFKRATQDKNLTLTDRDLTKMIATVKHLQDSGIDYELRYKNGAFSAYDPASRSNIQLTGDFSGSVSKGSEQYSKEFQTPLDIITFTPNVNPNNFPKYRTAGSYDENHQWHDALDQNGNVIYVRDQNGQKIPMRDQNGNFIFDQDAYLKAVKENAPANARKAMEVCDQYGIPYVIQNDPYKMLPPNLRNAAPQDQQAYIKRLQDSITNNHHGVLIKTRNTPDASFSVTEPILSSGFNRDKLVGLACNFELMDVAMGIKTPSEILNHDIGHGLDDYWEQNGAKYARGDYKARTANRFATDNNLRREKGEYLDVFGQNTNQQLSVAQAQKKLNEMFVQARKVEFNKNIDNMFGSVNLPDDLKYALDHIQAHVSADKMGDVQTVLKDSFDHPEKLTEFAKTLNDAELLVTLKSINERIMKHVDEFVGKDLNHFDPQYMQNLANDNNEFSSDYLIRILKASQTDPKQFFTKSDEVQLDRIVDRMVKFDSLTAQTIQDLDNNTFGGGKFERTPMSRYEMHPELLRSEFDAFLHDYDETSLNELLPKTAQNMDDSKLLSYLENLKSNDKKTKLLKERFKGFETLQEHDMQAYNKDLRDSLQYIQDTLIKNGITNVQAQVDQNGVVAWQGNVTREQVDGETGTKKKITLPVKGEIGQIFGTDKNHLMKQSYHSGRSKYFVPGNKGYYSFKGDSRADRVRIMSEKLQMRRMLNDAIDRQVSNLQRVIPFTVGRSQNAIGFNAGRQLIVENLYPNQSEKWHDEDVLKEAADHLNHDPKFAQIKQTCDDLAKGRQTELSADWMNAFMRSQGFNDGIVDLSAPTDSTMLNRLYSQEVYGTAVNSYEVLNAIDKSGQYLKPEDQHANLNSKNEQNFYQAKLNEHAATVLFSKDAIRNSATMASSVDMPHSTYHDVDAILAGHQNAGESLVDDSEYFDDEATGTGANQGRQQRLSKQVLDNWSNANYKGQPLNGLSTQIPKKLRNQVNGYDDPATRSPMRTWATQEGLLDYVQHDPSDRANMAYGNIKSSNNIARDVNVSMMTFGGWTVEDSVVISKKFAEKYQQIGKDGKYRPAEVGDKVSDVHGNKGVISLVVDPDMSDEEVKKLGLSDEVKIFRDNPDLDVVFDPQSPMSRCNLGLVHEAEQSNVTKLKGLDDCYMAKRTVIMTDRAVDADEHVVGSHGAGRKSGMFFQMALAEANCPALARTLVGKSNAESFKKFDSYLYALGYRMTKSGGIVFDTTPNVENNYDDVKTYDINKEYQKAKQCFDAKQPLDDTYYQVDDKGKLIPNVNKLLTDASKHQNVHVILPEAATINCFNPETNKFDRNTNEITMLPPAERDLRDLETGNTTGLLDDYQRILTNTMKMPIIADRADQDLAKAKTEKTREAIRNKRDNTLKHLKNATESKYRKSQDYLQKSVGGWDSDDQNLQKKMRNKFFAPKQANSGTLTAHADPRLSMDEVMISKDRANDMHIKDGQTVLIQRDPIQKVGNIRAVDVKISDDPNFHGMAMNGLICSSFDGDFDGDKYGIINVPLDDPEVVKEMDSLRPHNNILDRCVEKDNAKPLLDLSVEDGAGMLAACEKGNLDSDLFDVKEYAERADKRQKQIDQQKAAGVTDLLRPYTQMDYIEDKVTQRARQIEKKPEDQRKRAIENLSKELYKLEHCNFGAIRIRCNDTKETNGENLQADLMRMVDSGSKGSPAKVKNDMDYYHGFDNEVKDQNAIDYNYNADGKQIRKLSDLDATKMTAKRFVNAQTQKAMRIKTDFTAIAGALEQRLLKHALTVMPRECSEIAAGFYQNLLQAKHDPDDAQRRMENTNKMNKMLSGIDPSTKKPYGENHAKLVSDMKQLVIKDVGCKVSENSIEKLCDFMKDPQDPNKVTSIEDGFEKRNLVTNYMQLSFGHGTQTLTELANNTIENATERQKQSGKFITLVGDDLQKNNQEVTVKAFVDNYVAQSYRDQAQSVIEKQDASKGFKALDQQAVSQSKKQPVKQKQETQQQEVHHNPLDVSNGPQLA